MGNTDRVKRKPVVKRGSTPPRFAGEMLSVVSDVMSVEHLDSVLQKIVSTVADLFSIRALFISVLDENERVFRIRATHGYDDAKVEKIKKITHSIERMRKDLDEKYKILDGVYFIRPGPEEFAKSDEPFYFNIQDITKPRTSPDEWHELDYLKLVFTDKDGSPKGYIEIVEPLSRNVFDKETLEAMQIFSQLAGVAIENAKMFQAQVEIAKRSRFLADIIAHDINNFNQAVTSYLAMAQNEEPIPNRAMKYLDRASSSAWSISELIQRASKLARIEEEGARNMGPVDLGEVLKESSSEILREPFESKVAIDLALGNHRYFVQGNDLAKEIFVNLLHNAVEYDPHEDLKVDVSIGEFSVDYRRYWCVSIADNGIGIPDSKKNLVFGRFNREDDSMPASGLGLSIVRAIVEAYHGLVWVEDRVPGDHSKGCIFRVALPMTSAK
ncbi:MAG: HAMP domain-containing histidine kinase [Candidatus Thermoplasmatota archaeon]|nr:HAMP domain-containing histidine kinase [Candidatus Thermoplasmatota archaeon]